MLYETTLFVNTREGAVGVLTRASVHASCSPSPKSSPLLCSPLQSSLEMVDYATVVLLGLEGCLFGLKYVPGHGHGQKKLHYVFTVIQKNFVLKYFVVSNY